MTLFLILNIRGKVEELCLWDKVAAQKWRSKQK